MYVVTLCVCLLQICQLTCLLVEEVRRVLQAYCYQASYVLSTDDNGSCDEKSPGKMILYI